MLRKLGSTAITPYRLGLSPKRAQWMADWVGSLTEEHMVTGKQFTSKNGGKLQEPLPLNVPKVEKVLFFTNAKVTSEGA